MPLIEKKSNSSEVNNSRQFRNIDNSSWLIKWEHDVNLPLVCISYVKAVLIAKIWIFVCLRDFEDNMSTFNACSLLMSFRLSAVKPTNTSIATL